MRTGEDRGSREHVPRRCSQKFGTGRPAAASESIHIYIYIKTYVYIYTYIYIYISDWLY